MVSLEDRFWSKVDKGGDCWVWTASRRGNNLSRGCFMIPNPPQKRYKHISAHRMAWILTYGEIPDGLLVCHHCDNSLCVRPEHLFLGTQKDNIHDAWKKERAKSNWPHRIRESHGRAKLTEKEVSGIRNEYLTSKTTYRKLADKYKVSQANIWSIVKNRSWIC